MNNILLSISLLCAFIIGFFVAIKSVQLGLKWQIQTAEKKEPELNTPVKTVIDAADKRKQEENEKYRKEQLQEWMFGK